LLHFRRCGEFAGEKRIACEKKIIFAGVAFLRRGGGSKSKISHHHPSKGDASLYGSVLESVFGNVAETVAVSKCGNARGILDKSAMSRGYFQIERDGSPIRALIAIMVRSYIS